MDKNVIWTLQKLDTLYNHISINYMNYKFKYMTLEDVSQQIALLY